MNLKVSGSVIYVTLLALAFVFNANAQASTDDPSDASSSNLVNLIYYAHTGQFVFTPSFSSTFHGASGSSSASSSVISAEATYGASIDGLRFSISDSDYLNAYSQPGFSYYYTGLNDPNFSLNYRFIDNNSAGISADVEVSVSPSTGIRVEATNGQPGSNSQGAPNMELSAGVYWSRSINELEISAGIYRQFDGSGLDQGDSNTTFTQSSYWEGSAAFTDRVHLTPKFFVEGAAQFVFAHSTDYLYPGGGGNEDAYPFHVNPTLEVGYLHSKQFLISAFLETYKYTETSTNNITSDQTPNVEFATSWGMRMTLEF